MKLQNWELPIRYLDWYMRVINCDFACILQVSLATAQLSMTDGGSLTFSTYHYRSPSKNSSDSSCNDSFESCPSGHETDD